MAAPLSLVTPPPLLTTPEGRFISFAQNFEDVILWRVFKHVEKGFYVDVGAGDPFDDSVTYAFYHRGWKGINIEPNNEAFRLLVEFRPSDVNLNTTCGASVGMARFYCYGKGIGIVADRKDVRDIFERSGHTGYQLATGQTTLNHIFAKLLPKGQEIHFLKVDVEGSEREVFEGLDLHRYRPWVIVAEATLPCTQIRTDYLWDNLLGNCDYEFAYFDGLNCFYVAREHAELIRTIAVPPNIFDNFKQI